MILALSPLLSHSLSPHHGVCREECGYWSIFPWSSYTWAGGRHTEVPTCAGNTIAVLLLTPHEAGVLVLMTLGHNPYPTLVILGAFCDLKKFPQIFPRLFCGSVLAWAPHKWLFMLSMLFSSLGIMFFFNTAHLIYAFECLNFSSALHPWYFTSKSQIPASLIGHYWVIFRQQC